MQQRHYGMKLMAYTLMNLREFCGTSNLQPVKWLIQPRETTEHVREGNAA